MKRADILDTAKEYVTKDRATTHGDAESNFGLIATYWSAHLDANVTAADVAILMTLFKLARMKSNPSHVDSAIDAAAYSALAGEIATEPKAAPKAPIRLGSAI